MFRAMLRSIINGFTPHNPPPLHRWYGYPTSTMWANIDNSCISENLDVTMKNIEEHPNRPWNWKKNSENPNITMKIIETHYEKDWEYILEYKFIYELKRLKNIYYINCKTLQKITK